MESATLTLLDLLQATPPLLKACEAKLHADGSYRSDVKSLRLVSRQASKVGLQAVTGCCVTLTTESGSMQTIHQMARLLCGSPLQRLRVEVYFLDCSRWSPGAIAIRQLSTSIWQRVLHLFSFSKIATHQAQPVPEPSNNRTFSEWESQNPLHNLVSTTNTQLEVSSHATNLHAFVYSARTSLGGVTSLQVSFHNGSATHTHNSQEEHSSRGSTHSSTDAADAEICTILAQACPGLKHIGIGGGVGSAALRVFGEKCPHLSSMELLDSDTPGGMLLKLMQENALPHITHIRLDKGMDRGGHHWIGQKTRDLKLVAGVCACTTLTHLWTGEGYLSSGMEWLALPPNLQVLHCHRLPRGRIPPKLMLANLQRLQICDYATGIGASQLLSLLPAAPLLQSLSMTSDKKTKAMDGCWLILRPCSPDALPGLHLLHERVQSGLVLDQSFVRASTLSEERRGAVVDMIPVREILITLKCFPKFTHCELLDDGVYPISAAGSAGLAKLGDTLPELTYLHLSGVWREMDVTQLVGGRALKSLSLGGLHGVSKAALVQVVLRMPWLHSLEHNSRMVSTSTRELHAMLCGARGGNSDVGSSGGACNYLSEEEASQWVVSLLKKHRLSMLERWCKYSAADVTDGGDSGQVKHRWFGLGRSRARAAPHSQP